MNRLTKFVLDAYEQFNRQSNDMADTLNKYFNDDEIYKTAKQKVLEYTKGVQY